HPWCPVPALFARAAAQPIESGAANLEVVIPREIKPDERRVPMKFAWLCSHESYQPEALVEQATAAEEAGFDVVLGSDHFHPWVDDTSAAGFVWSWLGAVAQATRRVELGTSVTCPLFHYHPALVAQMAATTDRLSDGRLFLGVGTGEALNERS